MSRCNPHLRLCLLISSYSCLPSQNRCKLVFAESQCCFWSVRWVCLHWVFSEVWQQKEIASVLGVLWVHFEISIFLSFTVVSCGMPIAPVNGTVIGQHFTLGSRVTFSCNPGFRLANAQPVSTLCQESGRWSTMETRPRCVREFISGTISLKSVHVLIYVKDR